MSEELKAQLLVTLVFLNDVVGKRPDKGRFFRELDILNTTHREIEDLTREEVYTAIDQLCLDGYAEAYEENYGTAAMWTYYEVTPWGRTFLESVMA